jgi:protoporphyrinogen oxidase
MEEHRGEHVVSSMPIRQLVSQIEPRLPEIAVRSGNSLHYRDFLTVGLILRERNTIKDNWIYIHDPSVKMGRVQNYKAWSPAMVPDPNFCCYGLEYFCFEGDGLWTMSDADLIALGTRELEHVGLCNAADVVDGCVMRQPKAYPVYDSDYQQHVSVVRQTLDAHCPNLHLVGRNGMHKYNNQDHAMITALLAARNIRAGANKYDVWSVNEDGEYHESGGTGDRPTNGLESSTNRNESEQDELVG